MGLLIKVWAQWNWRHISKSFIEGDVDKSRKMTCNGGLVQILRHHLKKLKRSAKNNFIKFFYEFEKFLKVFFIEKIYSKSNEDFKLPCSMLSPSFHDDVTFEWTP